MAITNFGVIKATFTNYLNESENVLARERFCKFMNMIKESKSLRLQFEVYKNLESKYISNETLAMKYIDENIALFEKANIGGGLIQLETKKLSTLLEGLEVKVSKAKAELYESINYILSTKGTLNQNVDKKHEAYITILEFVMNNKPRLVEATTTSYNQIPKEYLVRKAIEKFNERFSTLNESDRAIFKSIVSNDIVEKQKVFVHLKEETVSSLKALIGHSEINAERVSESVSKIENMEFNTETFSNDVLNLHELKSDVTQ